MWVYCLTYDRTIQSYLQIFYIVSLKYHTEKGPALLQDLLIVVMLILS